MTSFPLQKNSYSLRYTFPKFFLTENSPSIWQWQHNMFWKCLSIYMFIWHSSDFAVFILAVLCFVLKSQSTEYEVEIRKKNSQSVLDDKKIKSLKYTTTKETWWCTVNYLDNCNVIWTQETNKFHFEWIHTIQWATLLVHLTTHMCTIMSCRHYA